LRILHVSTRLILGGSQENTVLSCEEQSRRGHDVHLAFGPILGPEGSLLSRVQSFRSPTGTAITTHQVPHLLREIAPLADIRARRELRTLIARLKPDVVHTHSSKAGILGRLAAWDAWRDLARDPITRKPIAIVHTIHGPPFMPIEGSPAQQLKIRALNRAYTLAERKAAVHCDAIVSVADAMTQQFLARGIGSPDLYTTVRSGMEVAPFLNPAPGETREQMRAKLNLAPDDFVIGTVARLAQHKGHDDLIHAVAPRLESDPSWRLLWVGDGWWRERLLAHARTRGFTVSELDKPDAPRPPNARLLVTGLVPPERIPGLIRAMDVLAHPSYREGLPRTVPQALLAGVCPVAYDVDGTREACQDERTGLLVRVGDVAALRSALERLYAHPDERQHWANTGREWCANAFSVEAMVDGLDAVYAQALELSRERLASI